MFWKKKKRTDPLFLMNETDDLRQTFRYVFKKDERPVITFLGETVTVIDLSAGGLAFINKGFKQYGLDRVRLDLTMPNFIKETRFTAQLRILHISENNICHCIFENCTVDDYELVHKFVLEMQKKDIQIDRS